MKTAQQPRAMARRTAVRWSLVYLVLALAWLLVSGRLASGAAHQDPQFLHALEMLKGCFFVSVSALLFFLLIRAGLLRLAVAQESTLQSESRLQLAVEGSGGGSWFYERQPANSDLANGRLSVSERVLGFIGASGEHADGSLDFWLQRMAAEDRDALLETVRQHSSDPLYNHEATYRIAHEDGSMRWLRVCGRMEHGDDDRPLRWGGMVWDVTEEYRVQERLLLAATLFENSNDGLVLFDANERVLSINGAFTRITGYAIEDIAGRRVQEILATPESLATAEQAREGVLGIGRWQGEYRGRTRDGRTYSAWLLLNRVKGQAQHPVHYIAVLSDLTALQESRDQVAFLESYDMLTQLPNEARFAEMLRTRIPLEHASSGFAVLLIDLDHFQAINHTLGRNGGNRILTETASRLRQLVGLGHAARLSGDSFALLCEGVDTVAQAQATTEAVLRELARGVTVGDTTIYPSACIGISLHAPREALAGKLPAQAAAALAESLLRQAAAALAEARSIGRGRYCFYRAEMAASVISRTRLESALRDALANNAFECWFQPRIDLLSGRWIGAEALVRWPSAQGYAEPDSFIEVAEDIGLIGAIDLWMMQTAVRQLMKWRAAGAVDDSFRLSVNVAAGQLSTALADDVLGVLAGTGLPASMLELELTERLVMADPERSIGVLQRLRERGVGIAVDDFGVGYSSLAYLRRLPLDALKVDKSFVNDLPADVPSMAIVKALLTLGQVLGLRIIAEGIETEAQRQALIEYGCIEGQGWLFSKALPAPQFEAALKQHDEIAAG